MTDWTIPSPTSVFGPETVTRYVDEGWWPGRALSELLESWYADDPDALAVVDDGDRSLTVAELRDRSWRLAAGLHDRGIGPGDRVLAQCSNRVEALICFFGVTRLGAVLLPGQAALRRNDIESICNRTGAVLAITVGEYRGFDHRQMFRDALPNMPGVREVAIIGADPEEHTPFEDLLADQLYDGPWPGPDDAAVVLFTSGTTAQPKGCVHTSNTLMVTGRGTGSAMGVTSDDVMFMPSPVMHTTGLAVGMLVPAVFRIPIVLQSVWEPSKALGIISRHHCTMTLGATTFATMMLAAYDPAQHDLSQFRYFGLGGAPIPADVVRRLRSTFGCVVGALYGSTEGLIVTATHVDDDVERIASSDGAPVSGVSVEIVDAEGNVVAAGLEGEVCIRTPGRFLCYWDDDERTRAAFDPKGRLHTGDLARMNEDGYIRLTGRMADLIIRGGMNISAVEVENLLLGHPGVTDIAVVAMPDDRLGERACAFVVATPGAEPGVDDLASFLESHGVAKFKYPERVEVVGELPRNPTGKVEKFKLRQQVRGLLVDETRASLSST